MSSIVGEEYVCYGESATGQFTPLIGVVKYDNSFSFREVTKDDLFRIPDDEEILGSWLFRKTSTSWVKRFAQVRGGFIFLSHSPQNDKPLNIIPLDRCRLLLPERKARTFDGSSAPAEAFEFEIRHKSRQTVRLYALSHLERQDLVASISARCDIPSNITDMLTLQSILKTMPLGSNIKVSNTKLSGVTSAPYANINQQNESSDLHVPPSQQHQMQKRIHNPFAPPRPPGMDSDEEDEDDFGYPYASPPPPLPPSHLTFASGYMNQPDHLSSPPSVVGSTHHHHHVLSPAHSALLDPIIYGSNSEGGNSKLAKNISGNSLLASNASNVSHDIENNPYAHNPYEQVQTPPPPPPPPSSAPPRSSSMHVSQPAPPREPPASLQLQSIEEISEEHKQQQQRHVPFASEERLEPKKLQVHSAQFDQLNSDLGRIRETQQILREREEAYLTTHHSLEMPNDAPFVPPLPPSSPSEYDFVYNSYNNNHLYAKSDPNESAAPSLAEVFRLLLFFCAEELAEDPQMHALQQFPHAKGAAVDKMLLTVYRAYTDTPSATTSADAEASSSAATEGGYMTLEHLVAFLEDAAFLQTHCPHGDNDTAREDFVDALDAVNLLRSLPRSIFSSKAEDLGRVDFGQWYQLLLKVTSIVYDELYSTDPTAAFSQLLFESIAPLYLFCQHQQKAQQLQQQQQQRSDTADATSSKLPLRRWPGKNKNSLRDPLLLEERIALVLITYAPNLWKVFLTYAADAVHKPPPISLPFPLAAQNNERGMHRLPPVAPERFYNQRERDLPDSFFVSETGWQRFCRDYGLSPFVVTRIEAKRLFHQTLQSPDSTAATLSTANTNGNRKTIISSKLPSRDMLPPPPLPSSLPPPPASAQPSSTSPVSPSKKEPFYFGHKSHRGAPQNTSSSPLNRTSSRTTSKPSATSNTANANTNANANANSHVTLQGLSFSEFVETIARLAITGLQQERYAVIFPSAFAKVLAVLTVWGVADLTRLEEVRTIRTDESY